MLDSDPGLLDLRRNGRVRQQAIDSDLPGTDNGSGEQRLGVSQTQEDKEDDELDPRASLEGDGLDNQTQEHHELQVGSGEHELVVVGLDKVVNLEREASVAGVAEGRQNEASHVGQNMEERENGKGQEGAVGGLADEPQEGNQKVGDVVVSGESLGVQRLALVGLEDDDSKGGDDREENFSVPEDGELANSKEGEGGKDVEEASDEDEKVA